MFFNNDILYHRGPMAIMWLAGNEVLGTKLKNKRKREVVSANISELLENFRKYFPEIGTANGLTLQKVGTLIRGLGWIYFAQMDELARKILHTKMRSVTARTITIDLPTELRRHRDPQEVEDIAEIGFGERGEVMDSSAAAAEAPRFFAANIGEEDEEVWGGNQIDRNQPEFCPSPIPDKGTRRRHGKRKAGEQQDKGSKVLKMVQIAIANKLLREDRQGSPCQDAITSKNILLEPASTVAPVDDGGFGFGDAMGADDQDWRELMQGMQRSDTGTGGMGVELIGEAERFIVTPAPTIPARGRRLPRRMMEDEEETSQQLQLPTFELPQQSTEESAILELESIRQSELDRSPRRRRPGKGLKIDKKTQMDFETQKAQIDAQPRPLPYHMLNTSTIDARGVKRKTGLALICASGRTRGIALTEFTRASLTASEHRRHVDAHDPDNRNVSDFRAGLSAEGNDVSAPMPRVEESATTMQQPFLPVEPEFVMPEGDADLQSLLEDVQQRKEIPEVAIHGPSDEEEASRLGARAAEPLNINQFGNDAVEFKELFHPGKVSRMQAAEGFFQLLKLKADQKIEMAQEEPYATIWITKQ